MAPPFIKRYLIALDRHKWAGIAGFLVVTGLSAVAAMLQSPSPDTYMTRGVLVYSTPPDTFSATGTVLQKQGQAVTKEMLLSDAVVNMVLQQLATQDIQLTDETLLRRSRVVVVGGSQAAAKPDEKVESQVLQVTVSYTDLDRQRSQVVAAALMNAMVEQSRQFNTQQLRRVIENLNQLLPKVTQELRATEQQLETFVRQEGTAIQAAQSGSLLTAITGSQQQQRQMRLALTGMDAQINSLQARLGMSADQAYAASALSADPIIGDLRAKIYQAEAQVDLLSKTLRPDHPSMVELRDQLSVYDQLLKARVTEVIGGSQIAAPMQVTEQIRQASSLDPSRKLLADTLVNLATQRQSLQQQFAALTRSEQELRQEYVGVPNKQLEQQRLQQQVALKQNFYNQVQARLADARLAQEETVGSLVVAQPPQTQTISEPGLSGAVILLVGSVVGVLVGGGLVMLLGSLDATFYTIEDLQAALRQQEVPVLGLLPVLPWDDPERLPVLESTHSAYLDPYERLRTNLRRAGGGKALKVVLLTSTVGSEGKSTTAYNLAIASARAGKQTLLIEADLRSPSQAQSLRVAPDPEAVLEPLRYYGDFSRCIRLAASIENLSVVPSAGPQRHAAAILESGEMRRLLEEARVRFDLVILDASSLSRSNDPLLLEPFSDGLAIVTRPGYTEEGLLNETTQQFIDSEDIQLLGAIINGADLPIYVDDFEFDNSELETEAAEPEAMIESETPNPIQIN
ncbi:MAG TPA: hypothetical protein V6D10_06805 [Trichocoleus sp.]|jgi:uncharacterized protein involved in exopolysaccharide biosynthesis/cellulose biosynthesis protein BcsQ